MATNFALTTASSDQTIIASLNYALANMNNNTGGNVIITGNVANGTLVANVTSGAIGPTYANGMPIVTPTGTIVSYLYGYIDVKYANSDTGGSGFSSNCTLSNYFGIRNTSSSIMDNNPVDYAWTQFAGGFGTTNGMYYQPMGGGAISFFIGNTAPTINFSPVIDNTPINLDVLANSIVTTHSILPGAVTGNLIAQATLTGNLIAAATITGNLIGTATVLGTNLVPNTITGNLIAQNTITGNLVVPGTITGNLILASTITGDLIAANTINATSIVAGSITSTQLQANLLSVGNIVSFGQTIESNSGVGYWLDYTNGNVYLGGNTHIGGNLTVGNNAVIGNNLTVNGLIILGAFESNTVVTNTIVDSSVTYGVSVYTNTVQDTYYTVAQLVGGGGPLSNQPNYYTAGNVVMLCDESPEPLYIWSTQLGEVLISKSTSGSITFTVTYWLSRFYANNVLASDYTYSDPAYTMTGYAGSYPFRPIFQIADYVTSAPGYYLYTAGVQVGFMSNYCAAPEFANVQVVYNQGTSIIQDFKK